MRTRQNNLGYSANSVNNKSPINDVNKKNKSKKEKKIYQLIKRTIDIILSAVGIIF